MKHTAERLLRFTNKNKVIYSPEIFDVVLRRFAEDKSINGKIRKALKNIDPHIELLVPYQVDSRERQFKRYLQNEFGLTINLSDLKKNHPSRYRKLQEFGAPVEVLKRWGLRYTYSRNIEVKNFPILLSEIADGSTLRRLYSDNFKLYQAIAHQAKKEDMNVKEYVERLGFIYEY